MNWTTDPSATRPTWADEQSTVVDDGQVIEKTLPVTPEPPIARKLRGQVDKATHHARSYVAQRPLHSTLIAAASGAGLAALVILAGSRANSRVNRERDWRRALMR